MSKPLIALLLLSASAAAQYNRHNVTGLLGAGLPRGELRPYFSDSFMGGIEYGYRLHPNFQVDAGFSTAVGAAGVVDWLPTAFGNLRIRDYQYFVPFGGRVILPIAGERFHIYGGLGGVYLRYTEKLRQPSQDFQIQCDVCASRDGFGYYGLFGVNTAIDRNRMFRVGVATKVYRGHTSGDAFGAAPPGETIDRWINIAGTLSFTF